MSLLAAIRTDMDEVRGSADAKPPEFSDESLALRFAGRHAGDLRFVAAWGAWFLWTGTHWKKDETLKARDFIREACREAANDCNNLAAAKKIASAKTEKDIEHLVRADRRLAATVDQWDADPWLLNTPAGVVDLRTAKIGRHDPSLFCTKITAAAPGGDAPRFLKFLDEITAGNAELQAYLQRAAGYMLTGLTREHALFFAYGTGANGKSVLVSTVGGLLGDYHRAASVETFTAGTFDRHPTELAFLRGARLVTATETEEGRRWAEARIKALTGGDRIAARFMRQDFFEYSPTFKLLIAGNHRPGLRSVDEAMRRRFHMIPFTVTIPKKDRDVELTEKLKVEWPGILAWMIEGCAAWLSDGLKPPGAVLMATETYLEAEDSFSTWLDECCETGSSYWSTARALFESWNNWARAAGEEPGSAKQFGKTLADRGFQPVKRNGVRGSLGIRVKSREEEEQGGRWELI